jgi:hypothetical protein
MKKLLSLFIMQSAVILTLIAQPVSDYTYKLDNGITVKMERCWNQVWVQQDYAALKAGDQNPLSVTTRTLGDLTSSSSFKLTRGGKEVKTQGAAPGTYDLKLSFKLSGKPGTLSFVVGNVVIKPKTKTAVTITLYDYQIFISESPTTINGLSFFDSKIIKYKGNTDQTNSMAIPMFYAKGKHDQVIPPAESVSKTSGKMKPGDYDVLISMSISGQAQKIWLENFTMKPDITYTISTNLNGGVIAYAGGDRDVKNLHLYPAGTAAKQTGTPAPIKNLELFRYENISSNNACAPGAYDVLLASGNKYEWRKNLIIKTGSKTEVR